MLYRGYGQVKSVTVEKRVADDGNDIMTGIVEGYLSTWDIDRAGDQFVKGSFRESIEDLRRRKRQMRLRRNHFGPLIGGLDPEKLTEDEIGLYGVADINLMVKEGQEAYALAKQGVLSDFSVGVSVKTEDMDQTETARRFQKCTIWETSLVDEPMNPRAMFTAVRSYFDPVETYDDAVAAVASYKAYIDEIAEDEREEVKSELDARFREIAGHESPLTRGTWSLQEVRALPKGLRVAILRTERLSRNAVNELCDILQPENEVQAPATEAGVAEVSEALKAAQQQDDTKAMQELLAILEGAYSE
jgi:HK97 family phage prohead protease